MNQRTAQCACGSLSVTCSGEPVRISMCHCLECQRRTGSVFSVNARFPRANVTVAGNSSTYSRIGDSGKRIEFRFCPDCGTTVCWTLDQAPGVIAVAVGCFAEPGFPAPKVSVYEARAHGWVHVPEQVVEHTA